MPKKYAQLINTLGIFMALIADKVFNQLFVDQSKDPSTLGFTVGYIAILSIYLALVLYKSQDLYKESKIHTQYLILSAVLAFVVGFLVVFFSKGTDLIRYSMVIVVIISIAINYYLAKKLGELV